jgi:hypothetical protein
MTKNTNITLLKSTVFALPILIILSACGSVQPPLQQHNLGDLGRFEYRAPQLAMKGVVVGAPHGESASGTAILARAVSDRTDAGFVAAYGFKSNRIAVARPLVRTDPYRVVPRDRAKRGSVFPEYKQILGDIAGGDIDFYLEFRSRPSNDKIERLQVVTSGFTSQELKIIKESYLQVRDRLIGTQTIQRLPMLIGPLETITWDSSAIRHHGLLLIAERGMSLRVPEKVFSGALISLYTDIFTDWMTEIVQMIQENPRGLQQVHVKLMDLGRFDLFYGERATQGIVIGSPHGSYDEYTAELVQQISHQTGLPAVISSGFTPTEAGGWRINVNRPTEKTYWAPEFEIHSQRSQDAYRTYKDLVFKAATGELALYFDIHQYGGRRIQVATVGIALRQAREIKKSYQTIRDRILLNNPDVDLVQLSIEPLDAIEIGAWSAKAHGILSVAKKSLHFELPLYTLFRTEKSRGVYAKILAELFGQIAGSQDLALKP